MVIHDNADIITQLRGGSSSNDWPYTCSLEDNYKDLTWLEISAKYNQLFCYILRNQHTKTYLGCLYIYPINLFFPQYSDRYKVDFSFWIIQEEYDLGHYSLIYKLLIDWLVKSWPFTKQDIYFRNKEMPN